MIESRVSAAWREMSRALRETSPGRRTSFAESSGARAYTDPPAIGYAPRRIPILDCASISQVVLMDSDRIRASWKQLIEKVAFHRGRRRRGDRNSVDLIGAASSTESSSADTQTTPLPLPPPLQDGESFPFTLAASRRPIEVAVARPVAAKSPVLWHRPIAIGAHPLKPIRRAAGYAVRVDAPPRA